MQKPTVGRVVHFFPIPTSSLYCHGNPLAATIVRVWSDTCVNLALFDGDAHLHQLTSVSLHQDGPVPVDSGYAAWPAREAALVTPPKSAPAKLAISDEMVGRFLSWPLPDDFAPDCGISFIRSPHTNMIPTGTNLLHFGQAKAMLEHCINGPASTIELPVVDPGPDAQERALTPGAISDQRIEAELLADGLNAPRVTADQIQEMMGRITYLYEQPKGTTSTFAHAFLGRFYIATGHSACVSPENFNAAKGQKYAREQAEGKARDKLWELEGYRLHATMVSDAELVGGDMAITG